MFPVSTHNMVTDSITYILKNNSTSFLPSIPMLLYLRSDIKDQAYECYMCFEIQRGSIKMEEGVCCKSEAVSEKIKKNKNFFISLCNRFKFN